MKNFLIFCSSLMLSLNIYAETENSLRTSAIAENQYIDVGTPNAKKLRIAIPQFYIEKPTSPLKNAALATTNRFKDILDFTNWFYFIPASSFASNVNPVTSTFKAEDWKLVQADFVILGKFYSQRKNLFSLELRAINVATKKIVAQKTYEDISLESTSLSSVAKTHNSQFVMPSNLNLILRDFGDVFIHAITGSFGPFMSQITFVGRISPKSQTSNIYIADFDGSNAYAITKNNTLNLSPAWSPDGKKITYTSFITGKAEIFEYNLRSKKTKQLTYENANSSGANWNPEGAIMAFSSSTPSGSTHIYTISGAGDSKEPLINSSGIEVEPAFSPNGNYLAYTSNKYSKPMIFLYNFETRENIRLTFSGWYNASAAWSPDSEKIAFASFDKDIDRWDLFKINVNGTGLERLTLKQGDNEKPSWSPDGRFIVFQTNRGEMPYQNAIKGNPYKLYVMSADGTNQRFVRTNIYDCRQPSWGPRLPELTND